MKAICRESTSWAAQLVRSTTAAIHRENRLVLEDFSCRLLFVQPNVFATGFPGRGGQHWLSTRLNHDYVGGYLVVNLSGCTYDTSRFQDPVMDVVMSGCVPPLDVLLRLCVSVHRWLVSDPRRVLVAHGTDVRGSSNGMISSFGPVVVFLACYLSWSGLAENPKHGVSALCSALSILDEQLWPSHRRYVKYFELFQHGLVESVGRPTLLLTCLVLVGIGGDGVSRVLELWQQDQLLFRSDLDSPDKAGAVFHAGVRCKGDVSVRLFRHQEGATGTGTTQLELQVCFHTAFVADGFVRFPGHQVDRVWEGASCDVTIDAFLEPASGEEPEDQRESAASAAAARVAMEGPHPLHTEACASAPSADVPDERVSSAQTSKFVFLPEDIDSFFDDL